MSCKSILKLKSSELLIAISVAISPTPPPTHPTTARKIVICRIMAVRTTLRKKSAMGSWIYQKTCSRSFAGEMRRTERMAVQEYDDFAPQEASSSLHRVDWS